MQNKKTTKIYEERNLSGEPESSSATRERMQEEWTTSGVSVAMPA